MEHRVWGVYGSVRWVYSEDRRVKKAFQQGHRDDVYARIAREPIRPSFEERRDNPRSSSAKLRWAVKAGEVQR
jgi:16S rRNA (cytosine1402-N4)-methyltransferase